MIAHARRASAILWRLLRSVPGERPFLVPGNVCHAVPATFRAAARRFEPIDIARPSLAMDKALCLARAAREPLAGLLYVHPYGALDGDVAAFFAALRALQPDLLLIDDRCLCAPAVDAGLTANADATLFSTGYGKYLDLGGGGFGFLRPGLVGAATEIRRIELEPPAGGSDPASVRPASSEDRELDLSPPSTSWEEHRTRIVAGLPTLGAHKGRLNAIYRRELPPEIALPDDYHDWRFNVVVPEPERLVRSLFAAGLFASRHYQPIVPEPAELPQAHDVHRRIVNLFNDLHYDEGQAERTATIVRTHVQQTRR